MQSPITRRRRRAVPAVLIASCLVLLTAGCASGSPAGSAGSATSANLNWWGWSPSVQVAQQYINAFNKVYPNIHITFKTFTIAGYNAALRPALASTVGPDIFDVAPGAANGSVETYAPDTVNLEPAVAAALGSDWQSKLSPIGVSSLTVGGKLDAVSVGAVYSGTVWINENLFKQYNLSAPTTLNQWVSDCATFKAHGIGCFIQGVGQAAFNEDTVQAISDNVQPGVWAKAILGQVPWTSPVIVKALTIWKEMFSDGIMEKGALGVQQYPDANNDFLDGKYAMVMMGTWYMQNDTQSGMSAGISGAGIAHPVNFTALPIAFPNVAGTATTGALYGDSDYGIAVNAKSGNQAAATKFAVWLGTSKAGQQQVANALDDIASLKGIEPNWSQISLVDPSLQEAALSQLITNAVASSEPRLATVSPNLQLAIGVATTTVAAGSVTPAQAAATL
jgi:raffinose/stachyose/melibiose transport system substrate-binding protein